MLPFLTGLHAGVQAHGQEMQRFIIVNHKAGHCDRLCCFLRHSGAVRASRTTIRCRGKTIDATKAFTDQVFDFATFDKTLLNDPQTSSVIP